MRKRLLGNTGLSVSELGLGTWGLSGDGYASLTESEQDRVIDRALALGITLFETADSYGKGAMEKKLGERLPAAKSKATAAESEGVKTSEPGASELAGNGVEVTASETETSETKTSEVIVVTKLGTDREQNPARKCFSAAFIRESFERSRERLKREVLDVVLLHNPSDHSLQRGEATGVLAELKGKGALRSWGVSVSTVVNARAALKQGAQVLEFAYNAFHSSDVHQMNDELIDSGVGVLARSVLAHGLLCGQWPTTKEFAASDHRAERWTQDDLKRRISQLNALRPCVFGEVTSLRSAALRYALANDRVSCAVLGPRDSVQLDQLLRDAGKEPPYLTPETLSALYLRLENVGIFT
jgi:aryl-alcohol dehydrogenase-like predicted oxidoreductase